MTPANQPALPSPASVADLEMRIDPERTLDLFTMTPKVSPIPLYFYKGAYADKILEMQTANESSPATFPTKLAILPRRYDILHPQFDRSASHPPTCTRLCLDRPVFSRGMDGRDGQGYKGPAGREGTARTGGTRRTYA